MASMSPTIRDPPCQPSLLPFSVCDYIIYANLLKDAVNPGYKVGNESFICTAVEGTGAQDTVDEVRTEIFTGAPETTTDETSDELEEFLFRAGVRENNEKWTCTEVEDKAKERRRFKSRLSAATFRDQKQAHSVDCEITGGGGMNQVSAKEGDLLRRALSVEVLESSTHNEPETESSLSGSETSESEGDAPEHLSRNMQFLSEKSSKGSDGDVYASPEHTAAGKMPKRTPEKAIKHKKQTVAALRDVGYAMATASLHSSFQTMKILPQHEVEENSCIKDTSEREKQSKKDLTFQSISEHFGRPLDDAAKSFGVSRSTLKRTCRDLGIKRWQYGKRRMGGKIPSKLEGRLNDKEPSTGNFSCWDTTPMPNKLVHGSHRSQGLNKMTIKATYKGVTIRFELPALSGIAELENNVIERLHLQKENFSIKYQDDEGDWILIACDKDVQECLQMSRTLNKTTVKMLLDLPYNPHAP